MADDLESGTDLVDQSAEPVETSLADDIRAAVVEVGADPAATDAPVRGPDGKFLPRQGAAPVTAQSGADQPAVTDPTAMQPGAIAAPQHWAEKDKAVFAKQSPEAQAWLLERHKSMEGDYTRRVQGIAEFQKHYEPVSKVFEPYMAQMQQSGYTPETYTKAWLGIEQRLMQRDPTVFAQAVKAYGFNPADVVAALQGGGQQQTGAEQQEYTDPAVAALKAQLDELRGNFGQIHTTLTAQQRAQEQVAQQSSEQQLESFATQKEADGKPSHPHFEAVVGTMLKLATAEIQSGRKLTHADLNDLYETACRADKQVYELVRAEERRADEAKTRQAARQHATAARTAGASVAGAPSAGQTPTNRKSSGSIMDDIRAAAAEHVEA